MPLRHERVFLSRFFNNNVQLVAKMCPRCYEECSDVKILSVNQSFLDQVSNHFKDVDAKVLDIPRNASWCSEQNQYCFFGFGEKEIDEATKCSEKLKKTVDTKTSQPKNIRTYNRTDSNNNIDRDVFLGFSCDDINNSRNDHQTLLKVSKLVRYKIYNRISLKAIKNTFREKNNNKRHRKTSKRKVVISPEQTGESVYFKTESDIQNNCSKYFQQAATCTTIKTEENNVQCDHIKPDPEKPEVVDYESLYFKSLNTNQFIIKPEHQWLPKKDFEDCIPEEKPTIWIPPRSPHNLIEEVLYHDPWALLVATIFLNKTSCMCARPYVFWFLTENPSPLKVLEKYPEDLEKYFVKLGLQRTRAVQVWRMSHDFVYKHWRNVKELYGIGRYGEDAFRMFCQGDLSVAPRDRFLRIYKAWYEKILMSDIARRDFEDKVF